MYNESQEKTCMHTCFFVVQKTRYMIVPTAAVRKMMQIGFHLYFRSKNKLTVNSTTSIQRIEIRWISDNVLVPKNASRTNDSPAAVIIATTAGLSCINTFLTTFRLRYFV